MKKVLFTSSYIIQMPTRLPGSKYNSNHLKSKIALPAAPHFEAWNLQLLRHRCAQLSDTFLHVVSNQLPGHGAAKQPRREHGGEFGSIETNSDMCFTENP